jgi:hypothetical protein
MYEISLKCIYIGQCKKDFSTTAYISMIDIFITQFLPPIVFNFFFKKRVQNHLKKHVQRNKKLKIIFKKNSKKNTI